MPRIGSCLNEETFTLTREAGPLVSEFPVLSISRMAKLVTASNFADPDAAYVMLVEARRGLPAEQSAALDARLALILANHIGDVEILGEAIAVAKRDQSGTR